MFVITTSLFPSTLSSVHVCHNNSSICPKHYTFANITAQLSFDPTLHIVLARTCESHLCSLNLNHKRTNSGKINLQLIAPFSQNYKHVAKLQKLLSSVLEGTYVLRFCDNVRKSMCLVFQRKCSNVTSELWFHLQDRSKSWPYARINQIQIKFIKMQLGKSQWIYC
jgi:hypothetical protein